jgi:hypothetical protein
MSSPCFSYNVDRDTAYAIGLRFMVEQRG